MFRRLTFAVGAAAGCAVVVGLLAGAGKRPFARLEALVRGLPGVQRWARGPSAASGGTPTTSGGVIPLETVPIDQLSEWELDLLTTPDS